MVVDAFAVAVVLVVFGDGVAIVFVVVAVVAAAAAAAAAAVAGAGGVVFVVVVVVVGVGVGVGVGVVLVVVFVVVVASPKENDLAPEDMHPVAFPTSLNTYCVSAWTLRFSKYLISGPGSCFTQIHPVPVQPAAGNLRNKGAPRGAGTSPVSFPLNYPPL